VGGGLETKSPHHLVVAHLLILAGRPQFADYDLASRSSVGKYSSILGGNLTAGESDGCRARELFYYLKGGQVDYGPEHSQVYGHARFGRTYETGEDFQTAKEHRYGLA
jgi:hypothetical protein